MARSLPAKDPNDILDYQVDWSRRLDPGDTIATAAFSLTTAAGLTISSSSKTDTTATVWLTGGTASSTGVIQCRVVTTAGRQMDHSFNLAIAER